MWIKDMGVNNETLYLKIEQNTIVLTGMSLNDIAKMECTNEAVLRQLKTERYTVLRIRKMRKREKSDAGFSLC